MIIYGRRSTTTMQAAYGVFSYRFAASTAPVVGSVYGKRRRRGYRYGVGYLLLAIGGAI